MLNYKNGEDYYHKIYLMFNGFVALSLVPFGYLILEKTQRQIRPVLGNEYVAWVVTALLLISGSLLLYTATKRFSLDLSTATLNPSLRLKLNAYFFASRRKIGAFTLGALIFDAGLFLTGNSLFIVGFVVSMVLLSLGRPTLKLIIDELQLNESATKILREKTTIEN